MPTDSPPERLRKFYANYAENQSDRIDGVEMHLVMEFATFGPHSLDGLSGEDRTVVQSWLMQNIMKLHVVAILGGHDIAKGVEWAGFCRGNLKHRIVEELLDCIRVELKNVVGLDE